MAALLLAGRSYEIDTDIDDDGGPVNTLRGDAPDCPNCGYPLVRVLLLNFPDETVACRMCGHELELA